MFIVCSLFPYKAWLFVGCQHRLLCHWEWRQSKVFFWAVLSRLTPEFIRFAACWPDLLTQEIFYSVIQCSFQHTLIFPKPILTVNWAKSTICMPKWVKILKATHFLEFRHIWRMLKYQIYMLIEPTDNVQEVFQRPYNLSEICGRPWPQTWIKLNVLKSWMV